MEILRIIFYIFFAVYILMYILLLIKTKKFFKNLAINAIIGIVALFVLALLKGITGFYIPLNQYTVVSSGIGGLPAVCGLLILRVFLNV